MKNTDEIILIKFCSMKKGWDLPEISIHRVGPADTATVARFVHALLGELTGGNPPHTDVVLQNAELVLSEERVIALLACQNEMPVGVMVLNECAAIYAGGRFGEISELYVLPDMRSQGVARHLLDAAMLEATARGWKRLEVGAPHQPTWRRTLNFYLRNGFEEVGPRLRRLA